MASKISLRKNYLKIRKKKYFEIKQSFFYPLLKLIKTRYNKKFVNLSSYYPSYFEVNTLKLFETSNYQRTLKYRNIMSPHIPESCVKAP